VHADCNFATPKLAICLMPLITTMFAFVDPIFHYKLTPAVFAVITPSFAIISHPHLPPPSRLPLGTVRSLRTKAAAKNFAVHTA